MKINFGLLNRTIWLFTYILIENFKTNTMSYNECHSRSLKVNWTQRKHIILKYSTNILFLTATFSLLVQIFNMSSLNMDTQSKTLHSLKSEALLRSGNFSAYIRTAFLIMLRHSPKIRNHFHFLWYYVTHFGKLNTKFEYYIQCDGDVDCCLLC